MTWTIRQWFFIQNPKVTTSLHQRDKRMLVLFIQPSNRLRKHLELELKVEVMFNFDTLVCISVLGGCAITLNYHQSYYQLSWCQKVQLCDRDSCKMYNILAHAGIWFLSASLFLPLFCQPALHFNCRAGEQHKEKNTDDCPDSLRVRNTQDQGLKTASTSRGLFFITIAT